jgi:hypothetical protein
MPSGVMKSKINELIKIPGKVFFANKTTEKHLARMVFNFSEKKTLATPKYEMALRYYN